MKTLNEEKKSILLVEDEVILAYAEASTLRKHGFDVIIAKSAAEAIQKARELPLLDLILMDINLGEAMDGTEAAEIILRERDIPVLFLSSHTEPEILSRTENVTSYGYVVKNSGETVLLASLRMAFRLHAAHRELAAQTERLETTSAALKEKSEELEQYFTNSLDLLCIADTDGYFRRMNPEWQAVLGYSLEELEGKRFMDLVHPEDRESTLEAVRALGDQQPVINFVNRNRTAAGGYRWIEWRALSRGKLIYATARDISEHRNTEEALRASEAYQRAIIDHAPFGGHFYKLLPDGRLIFEGGNPAADRILGIEHRSLDGKTIEEAFPGLTGSEIAATYKRIAESGGTAHWDQTNYDEGGISGAFNVHAFQTTPGRIAVFFVDITERKQSEKSLADALREKSALLQELQHRVKNSLVMIMSLVSLELDRSSESKTITVLEDLKTRISTLAGLFVLLEASGDEHGICLDVYLRQITDSLLSSYKPSQTNVAGRIIMESVAMDTKRAASVGLILNELITNALKYAFPGGRSGTIEVRLASDGADVVLQVADDGIGLPEGFDPKHSSGLGLEIVRILVEQLGGSFDCERAGGTVFRIRLPSKSSA